MKLHQLFRTQIAVYGNFIFEIPLLKINNFQTQKEKHCLAHP